MHCGLVALHLLWADGYDLEYIFRELFSKSSANAAVLLVFARDLQCCLVSL